MERGGDSEWMGESWSLEDMSQMYFSPRKRLSGAFPLCINPGESLVRSTAEFMDQGIPQAFIEYLLCPGLERLDMEASSSFWVLMKNGPAQLSLTQSECAYLPCLIPTHCHSLPLPSPPDHPSSKIFWRGEMKDGFYDHRLIANQPLLLFVICLKGWSGDPFMQSFRAGRPEEGIQPSSWNLRLTKTEI